MLQVCQEEERQLVARNAACQEPHLDLLAISMCKSSGNELAAIKGKSGYRSLRLVLKFIDPICRCDLYSYIGPQSLWLTGEPSDLDSKSSWNRRSQLDRSMDETNRLAFDRKRRCTPAVFMSRLLLSTWLACALSLGVSTFFQYRRDYYQIQLVRLNTSLLFAGQNLTARPDAVSNMVAGLSYNRALALEQELRCKEQRARAMLEIFGSFLMQHPYFCESLYTLPLLFGISTYLAPMLYYHLKGSFDLYFYRLLLDWDQEQVNCNRMIEHLVKQFASSSRNFLTITRERKMSRNLEYCFKSEPTGLVKLYETRYQRDITRPLAAWASISGKKNFPLNSGALVQANSNRDINHYDRNNDRLSESDWPNSALMVQQLCSEEHRWVVRKLRQLALAGQLQPLDRSNVDELDARMICYTLLASIVIVSVLAWDAVLYSYLLPVRYGFKYELDFMDQLTLFDIVVLNIFLTLGATFHLGIVLVHCCEHVESINKLQAKIVSFVQDKRRLLDGLQPKSKGLNEYQTSITGPGQGCARHEKCAENINEIYESINSDLLLILMHYRIFATQLKPARKSLGFVLFCSLVFMVCFPIVCRLHLPYVCNSGSRVIAIAICLITILGTDVALTPVCWLSSRSLDLCKSLWNLMATLVIIADHPKYGHLLSEHSVWLLRKELSHPERLKKQFAVVTLGVEFTYAELLKVHFWLSLMVSSLIYEIFSDCRTPTDSIVQSQGSQTRASVFENMFSDPLGIINGFGG